MLAVGDGQRSSSLFACLADPHRIQQQVGTLVETLRGSRREVCSWSRTHASLLHSDPPLDARVSSRI